MLYLSLSRPQGGLSQRCSADRTAQTFVHDERAPQLLVPPLMRVPPQLFVPPPPLPCLLPPPPLPSYILLGPSFFSSPLSNTLHSEFLLEFPLSQPSNILLKGTRQDRRGFTVRISDFGFSTMRGTKGE